MPGSKPCVNLLGCSSPAGHYKTVTEEQSCHDGDWMNGFDNEQVISNINYNY